MKMKKSIFITTLLAFILLTTLSFINFKTDEDDKFVFHKIDLSKQNLELYWKDELGKNLSNFRILKQWLGKKNEELVFATNGGMYLKDRSPQGLFIQNGVIKKQKNRGGT